MNVQQKMEVVITIATTMMVGAIARVTLAIDFQVMGLHVKVFKQHFTSIYHKQLKALVSLSTLICFYRRQLTMF